MKKNFILLFFFTAVYFNSLSIRSHAIELPLELQPHNWYTAFNDVDNSIAWSVSMDPKLEEDTLIIPTPAEVYWRTYHDLRSKGYGYNTAERISTERSEAYNAQYDRELKNAKKQTLQYWLGTFSEQKDLVFTKVSVDLKEFQYRIMKQYTLESGENKRWKVLSPQDSWHSIEANQVVKKSLEHLMLSKQIAFTDEKSGDTDPAAAAGAAK